MSTVNEISYSLEEVTDEALGSKAQSVIKLLTSLNMTITTAESCTGGMVASFLTSVPGSSQAFEGGFVTYSNRIKHKLIDVDELTLERCGAVSQETVEQMAAGAACALGGVNVSISVSGIAGPDGGSVEKPVGTVWFGCYLKSVTGNERLSTHHCLFKGDRNHIRRSSVRFILTIVETELLKLL